MGIHLGSDGGGRIVVRVALFDGRKDSAVQHRIGVRRRDRAGRGVPGIGGRGTGAGHLRGSPGQKGRRPEATAIARDRRQEERTPRCRRWSPRAVSHGTPASTHAVHRKWTGSGAPVAMRRVRGRHGGRHYRRLGSGAVRARTPARGRFDHRLPAAAVPAATRRTGPAAVAVPAPAVRRVTQHLLALRRMAATVGPGRVAFAGRIRQSAV